MFGDLINPWWAFILLGILAGIASGLLGIGGGVIIVPVLVLAFAGFDQKMAQGISLSVLIPVAIVGALRYMHNPNISVNYTVAVLIAIGAVVGSLIGTELVARLPVSVIRKSFAVLMLIVAVKMFIAKPQQTAADTTSNQTPKTQTPENT